MKRTFKIKIKVNLKGYILFELKLWKIIKLMVILLGIINYLIRVNFGKFYRGYGLMFGWVLRY